MNAYYFEHFQGKVFFFVKKQINEPLSTSFIDSHFFLGRDEEDEVSLDDDSDSENPEEDAGLFPEIIKYS